MPSLDSVKKLIKECNFQQAGAKVQELLASSLNEEERIEALCILTFTLYCRNRPDEAMNVGIEALELAEKSGMTRPLGHVLRVLGVVEWAKGNHLQAIAYCRRALKIAYELQDKELEYLAMIALGSAFVYMNEFVEAIESLESSLEIAEKYEDWNELAVAYTNLGNAYAALGENERALGHHLKAHKIYLRYPDPQRLAFCLMNIAQVYVEKEDYETALDYHSEALDALSSGWNPLMEAAAKANLGESLYWLKRTSEAFDSLEDARRGFEVAGYLPGLAEILPFLGCCYIKMGKQEEGLAACKEGLHLANQSGRKDIQVLVLLMAGCGHHLAGDDGNASNYLEAALALARMTRMKRAAKYAEQFLNEIGSQSKG